MSFTKIYLCDLCIILLFGFSFILADDIAKPQSPVVAGPKGNCSCGGFSTPTPDLGTAPLLSQSPGLVIKCDDEGGNTCKSLCTALATATKAKGPEILCNKLKDADELKLSAFYKICDKPWMYANLTADEHLCCENTKVKLCPSVEREQAANGTTISTSTITTIEPKSV